MTAMLCHRTRPYPRAGQRLDGRAKNKTPHTDCRKPESREDFGEPITYLTRRLVSPFTTLRSRVAHRFFTSG